MKTLAKILAGSLMALTGAAAASAQEIVLYDGSRFGGEYRVFHGPVDDLSRGNFNDKTASIRVISGIWEVCEHAYYRGHCEVFEADHARIGYLDDEVSSLRPLANRPGYGNPGYGNPGYGNHGYGAPGYGVPGRPNYGGGNYGSMTLFSGPNFTGRSVTIDGHTADLRRYGFNDQAQSIRVNGRGSWRVCQHINFGGSCMQVDNDLPMIGGGMSRQISSASPDGRTRGGNRPQNGAWLYSASNLSGQRVDVMYDTPDLRSLRFNDETSSLIIARGEVWEACEHANYRGRCEYFEGGDVVDLRNWRFDNQISSMRRVNHYGPRY